MSGGGDDERDQNQPGVRRAFSARVFIHERHLDEPLSLETLSAIAHSSPYHFHRQFTACSGVPLYRYIQWLRLRRACWRLAFRPQDKIIDIALDAGVSESGIVQSCLPCRVRSKPQPVPSTAGLAGVASTRFPKHTLQEQHPMVVKIVQFPETQVAMLRHRGSPDLVNATAAQFIAWRKASGLSPVATSATWGVSWDDPAATPADDFRFDICGSVQRTDRGKRLWRGEWHHSGRAMRSGAPSRLAGYARAKYLVSLPRLATGRRAKRHAIFRCFFVTSTSCMKSANTSYRPIFICRYAD
ncbi:AraC family transcriptional regulator [Raoultella ornithinolytica]|nr:AraC family transcriptional regulator [Raoultella ornithinolytica]